MKKSIILLLSMSLIFSLSACGDNLKQGTTQESIVASEEEAPEEDAEIEAEPEETAEETLETETEQEEPSNETEADLKEPDSEKPDSMDLPKISDLTYNGENVIDVTVKDMKEYDYIKDVYIQIDESEKKIDIVVQIPSATDEDTAKMAGEDVARYLAACAAWSDSSYSTPGSEDIGGIYETYDLLIYIDDANHNFDIYGAKVTSANKITW